MSEFDVFQTNIKGMSQETFLDSFETICKNYHKELKVLSFAIILYDESIPEFVKLLRDNDYWKALDKSSGDKLVIFTVRDEQEFEFKSVYHKMVSMPSSDYGKMYSSIIKKLFDDENLLVYPSVLFFQIFKNEIYDYRLIPLNRSDVHSSFTHLQNLLKSISDVLNKVLPKYYDNQREIFELIKTELLNQKYTMYIKKGPKSILELISLLKSLL